MGQWATSVNNVWPTERKPHKILVPSVSLASFPKCPICTRQ